MVSVPMMRRSGDLTAFLAQEASLDELKDSERDAEDDHKQDQR